MPDSLHFITGKMPTHAGPLTRFLPPIPDGLAKSWLQDNIPNGSWVIDPFGSLPRLAVEAARAGYRILVTANNPIERFLLEISSNPPDPGEFQAALADLAVMQKAGERIEGHIRSIYKTICANCGREIEADAYIWDRDANAPNLRIYHCPHCDDQGEHHVSQSDIDQASKFERSGMHYARALERVATINDPDRMHAEEALATYTPRTVFALFTIINKLDNLPPARRRLMSAILISALDRTNSLWSYPIKRTRPKQLSVSSFFEERNLWLALEQACQQLSSYRLNDGRHELPFTTWPDIPPESGGVCLYEGPLRDLIDQLPGGNTRQINFQAVLTALPRPNQAYWTLSALWAGWIWGHESSTPLKRVLRRRRYDWSWHAGALYSAFQQLSTIIDPGTPFLGLIGEAEPGFIASAIIAAELAGFTRAGIALRVGSGQAQIHWVCSDIEPSTTPVEQLATKCQELARDYLLELNEPCSYINLHAAVLSGLSQSSQLKSSQKISPGIMLSQINDLIADVVSNREMFMRLGGSESSFETRQWWLSDEQLSAEKTDDQALSLADRVEMSVVRHLQNSPGKALVEIDQAVCKEFPGLMTPEIKLTEVCLDSYGEQHPPESGGWRLRPEDIPENRRSDLGSIYAMLEQIGKQLEFSVLYPDSDSREIAALIRQPIIWQAEDGKNAYMFFVLASAILGNIINSARYSLVERIHPDLPPRNIIVVPGGRASLIHYKLERNASLRKGIEVNWRFVKFRHVRRLFESSKFNRDNLDLQLEIDPLAYEDPQLPLL